FSGPRPGRPRARRSSTAARGRPAPPAARPRPGRAAAPRARSRPAPRAPRTPRPPAPPGPGPARAAAPRWPAAHRRGTGGRRLVASPPLFPKTRWSAFGRPQGRGGYDGATMLEVLDQARLLVVTGKGGTGKTTVAAGLAVAAAGAGRRVLVAEVEGRPGLAGLLGGRSLGHREARVAHGVHALAVDPDESLRDYLDRYGFAPLARLLSWAHLNRFITAAAPGLGDVLLVGEGWEGGGRAGGA